jgi:methylamine dehydrogenase light chain
LAKMTLDALGERLARRLAGGISRRSTLARLGAFLAAAPLLPILPVARAEAEPPSAFTRNAQTKDAKKCDYWRYCAIDGLLCTCCGGGMHYRPQGDNNIIWCFGLTTMAYHCSTAVLVGMAE